MISRESLNIYQSFSLNMHIRGWTFYTFMSLRTFKGNFVWIITFFLCWLLVINSSLIQRGKVLSWSMPSVVHHLLQQPVLSFPPSQIPSSASIRSAGELANHSALWDRYVWAFSGLCPCVYILIFELLFFFSSFSTSLILFISSPVWIYQTILFFFSLIFVDDS